MDFPLDPSSASPSMLSINRLEGLELRAMNVSMDQTLRDQFLALDRSVDDLLCHPDEAKQFAELVNLKMEHPMAANEILRRLIAMRKLGEDRGGLPRTTRNYRGRGSSPR